MMAMTTGFCLGLGGALCVNQIVPVHIFGLCVAVGGLVAGLTLGIGLISLYFG